MKFLILGVLFINQVNASDSATVILEKYFQAIGGKESWEQVTSVKIISRTSYVFNGTWINRSRVFLYREPGLFYSASFSNAENPKAWVYDGTDLWEKLIFSGDVIRSNSTGYIMREGFLSYPTLILQAKKKEYTGTRKFEGRTYFLIKIESDKNWIAEYYFNKETYLLDYIKLIPSNNYISFYEYKWIQGLSWPMQIIGIKNEREIENETNIDSVFINMEIPDIYFKKESLEFLNIH